MHLVSRALVRVRAMLFGPPGPPGPSLECDRAAHEPAPGTAPPAPLATARRHRGRTRCLWLRTELPEITAEDIASTLVGAYVLTPEVRQQMRQRSQQKGLQQGVQTPQLAEASR